MVDPSNYKLLFDVNSPQDIKDFNVSDLTLLCREIRDYMIDVISQIGGHFGGGLGTVELTVALHKVFNTPNDLVVWDTGHQAYPHKIITGRRDELQRIRKLGGISGFLKRTESEYDAFGAGHASTSLSSALGMAVARDFLQMNKKVVAVIGDGAMTGGMAYEAMNNSGLIKTDFIVVLNDNQMSIAPNMWQLSNYFNEMISHPEFNKLKGAIWDLTGKLDYFGDRIRKLAVRLESGIKSIITPGMLFEALGFRYFGPINGHNVGKLVKLFEHVKQFKGPILIHAITEKGKGYEPAEGHSQRLHASKPFDKVTGKAYKGASGGAPSYTSVFSKAMVDITKKNDKVIGITAAMPDGTGLDALQKEVPDKYFDVGIAEQHAVTFSAGMATQGMIPVAAIYSTFLQRAFDQIIHDVSLQKLHVVFVLDRGGLVGADGPTHHGTFDLTYLRMIPDMVVMTPKNEQELRDMLWTAIHYKKGPIALRYPRGNAIGVEMKAGFSEIPIGKGEILSEGEDVALLAVGKMVDYAYQAAEQLADDDINCEVVNMRFIKPLDKEMLDDIAYRFDKVVTLEENALIGGFGAGVLEYFADKNFKNDVLRIGIPDRFIDHGKPEELHEQLKIDPKGIVEQVKIFSKGKGIKQGVPA